MPYVFSCEACDSSIYVNRVPDINTKYTCKNCDADNWIDSSFHGLTVIDKETFQYKTVEKVIECPSCNKPQNRNAIFCKDCGTEIYPKETVRIGFCVKCDSEYDKSYKYCEKDGNSLVYKDKEIDTSPKNIKSTLNDNNIDEVSDLPMKWYQFFNIFFITAYYYYIFNSPHFRFRCTNRRYSKFYSNNYLYTFIYWFIQ